jgi:hypothetical protein
MAMPAARRLSGSTDLRSGERPTTETVSLREVSQCVRAGVFFVRWQPACNAVAKDWLFQRLKSG